MPEAANHYDTLGINPAATVAQVRRAYRHKARELHPDVNPASDAAARFAALQAAYAVLSNAASRRSYDEAARGEVACPPITHAHSGHTDFTNIAAPRGRPARPRANGQHTADPGDPTGFDELYQAFFAPRAAAARKRA